ncbi:FAD/NAD(P)-binding domain-containing protein [Cutaneotrichosporon oleaginosum]|uniref:NADH:ubiquinone reductase (non-electrogenic) n=1 Tax=Cutaneotrichosporon oleaginosum TaxID=879819 RepID=A0A0J1BAI4_9TREE|nr:FAD/NAD(P)-binding domain-containing protein [Cutaneotrichosporon oleaginosum]KLT44914.1 FAD/NAD(P)-binding domain-containing protein [Cutaneotrichosporon oleaginosum]
MAFRQLARTQLITRPTIAPRALALAARPPVQFVARRAYVASVQPPPPGQPEAGPQYKKKSGFRRAFTFLTRATVIIAVGGVGAFLYVTQTETHPGEQLPQDPTKKTLVVLGSGWGATSFLKNLDTEEFNVIVISPRNYFLFTPLLPSVTVGTLEARSLIQPTRFITRHKKRSVLVYEAQAQDVDPINKTVTFTDSSEVQGESSTVTINYDYLVYAVGCENQTFGIKGVTDHACFLKELSDADKIRQRLMDCIETAAFPGQTEEEIDRLMHMVVVGGGPTGVEYAGELHDFLIDDLRKWYPEIADKLRITLIEALPNVLPAFSKELIRYTESTFKENKIEVLTRTMVKDVGQKSVLVQDANKEEREIPYGLLVWATGNTSRPITRNLLAKLPNIQTQRRGIVVDDYLSMLGADGVFAIGDCTATQYAPTAQVASQQGQYLAQVFGRIGLKAKYERRLAKLRASGEATPDKIENVVKKLNRVSKITPFHYSHQGSLAYIGSEKAIADLPLFNGNVASGGGAAMLFWRSAYVSTLYSVRNRTLVMADWLKVKLFGRDVSRE